MAVKKLYSESRSCFLADKASAEQERNCLCCIELSKELEKMKTEILSYEEIIKVLQNEIRNKELTSKPESMVRKDFSGDRLKANTDKDWVQVSTRNNRKPNNYNSNFMQLIPTTGNKYELLHTLKDDEL
jgi:hypothetical protein